MQIKSLFQKTRYELIQYLYNINNCSISKIQDVLDVSQNTIKNAIRCTNLENLPSHGRPHLLKQCHIDYIEARTLSNRVLTNQQLANELVSVFPNLVHCSKQTISRARKSLGLHYLPMRKNCVLTQNARDNRVKWCQKMQEIGLDWIGQRLCFRTKAGLK